MLIATHRAAPQALDDRRRLALAALALPLFIGLLAARHAAAQPATATAPGSGLSVPTAVVETGREAAEFSLTGAIQAVRQVTLGAQVSGNVVTLAVKAGDRVRSGQLLARIDDRSSEAGLRASAAGVDQAQAQWQNAKLAYDRSRELRQQGFVSQAAVDAAQTQLQAAQAGLAQAQAGRSQAALVNGFTTVVAPFDGFILAVHTEAGELATPGRPLVTLYAPGRMRAVVEVPASRSTTARAATKTEIQLPDGRWVVPTGRTDLPSADPVSQTVEWRLDLPAEAGSTVAPGQSVQVRFAGAPVASGAVQRPRVPTRAVLQRGELSAVYAVHDGRFVLRPVRLGPVSGQGMVEVLAGLRPGERYALDAVRAGLAGATPAR